MSHLRLVPPNRQYIQSEPGEHIPRLEFVVPDIRIDRPGWDLADDERGYFYSLKEGEHAIYSSSYLPSEIWFCAPLKGIEAPSE